jgi:hypothetical protein
MENRVRRSISHTLISAFGFGGRPTKRRPFVSNTFGEHWDKAQDGDMTAYPNAVAVPQVREFSGLALPDRCRGRA